MKNTLTIKVIKLIQPIGELYICSISPNQLLEMSKVDRRRIENHINYLGIQRELRKEKIFNIKNYLQSFDATFPNSIILNLKSENIISENEHELVLNICEDTFTILDGQHRLEGFRDNIIDNFDIIITIFKDLKEEQQANIFSTINSEQTKVDPSLNLNLELNSTYYTPKKFIIELAQSFNFDRESPWFKNIKMLGAGNPGIISLSAFVSPLLEITYPDNQYYLIRNEIKKNPTNPNFQKFNFNLDKYFLWDFYINKNFDAAYKILYNYFRALSEILNEDWLNHSSLLNKTTGYNAQIYLFIEIARIGFLRGNLTYDFFYEYLKPLNKLNGQINSMNFGTSGTKASSELLKMLKKQL